jgi:predicted permease
MDDFKYTLRTLTRAPLFTGVALLTLALCIGANSAIFSVLNGILLKPYPWPSSERLVAVYNSYPLMGLQNAGVSVPDYLDRKAGVAGFEDAAMYTGMSFNLGGDGEPLRIVGQRATPSLFSTLQSGAALGRVFTEADAIPGSERVVILSHALWRDQFGSDRGVIGRKVQLNTLPYEIVGVMPDWFYFPTPRVQMWVPFAFTEQQKTDNERGNEFSSMIARVKPGASNTEIQRDLDLIQTRNAERLTDSRDFFRTSGFGGRFAGFLEQNVGNVRAMLWLVQAGVFAALLIGCANVASLLLARAVGRERELAIRSAVGAARGRLIALLLTESLVLFVAGGALGILVAWWGIGALESLGLQNLPRGFDVSLDATVLGFTLLAALLTGVVFGALPAWTATRGETASTLKESGSRGGSGRRTQFLRSGLVVTEIALAVMLLATAALLIRSFERLQREDPGFRADGVLTVQLTLPAARYDVPEKRVAFVDSVLARLRALPGVTGVSLTTVLPFTGNNSSGSYSSPSSIPSTSRRSGFRCSRGVSSTRRTSRRPSAWRSSTSCSRTSTGPARIRSASASAAAATFSGTSSASWRPSRCRASKRTSRRRRSITPTRSSRRREWSSRSGRRRIPGS